jgi:excisionase family DNA binding protein
MRSKINLAPHDASGRQIDEKGNPMRSREVFFAPWQAADYTGLKIEAVYEMLASGELQGEQIDGRWRLRKSLLDAWLDAEVEPEELQKLTTRMSHFSAEQAQQVLEEQGLKPQD